MGPGGDSPRPDRDLAPGWHAYGLGLGLVVLASLLGLALQHWHTSANQVLTYLVAVVVAAVYLGRGPALLVSCLSVVAFDFFVIPPPITFAIPGPENLPTLIELLIVSLVISSLTTRLKTQIAQQQRQALATQALYAMSRDLAAAEDLPAIIQAIVANIGQTFEREVVILLPASTPEGDFKTYPTENIAWLDAQEKATAVWVREHQEPAGRGTDSYPQAQAHYLPLRTAQTNIGVLGVRPVTPGPYLTPEQRQFLATFASVASLAIERVRLAETARRAQVLEATEKLQTALLNAISHDLRTPLVTITGALTGLEQNTMPLDDLSRQQMIRTAREEAQRLNWLVGNLLDMTRLEAGTLHIKRTPCDTADVIGTALEQMGSRLNERPLTLTVPATLPLVQMDFVLIAHVLINLLDNALKYSPAGSPLEISAQLHGTTVEIAVTDHGPGLSQEDLERVFDKFYRASPTAWTTGIGLGLSISKGIVEAHGGQIWAQNHPTGGLCVHLTLPLTAPPLLKNSHAQHSDC